MNDHRDTKLHELRRRVTTGEYRVDLGAVADAIVRRNGAPVHDVIVAAQGIGRRPARRCPCPPP